MIDHVTAAAKAKRMLDGIGTASGKPILLIGYETDRSATLAAVAADTSATPQNLGLELSQALIDAAGSRLDLSATIADMRPSDPVLLLDRIQILMLPQLNVNALDILVRVARRRRVCASWPGRLTNGRLRYADPDHPECLDDDASRALVLELPINESAVP